MVSQFKDLIKILFVGISIKIWTFGSTMRKLIFYFTIIFFEKNKIQYTYIFQFGVFFRM